MVVRQIRNATLFIDYAGLKFLIDPVFAQKATYPPFPSLLRAEEYNPTGRSSGSDRRNMSSRCCNHHASA